MKNRPEPYQPIITDLEPYKTMKTALQHWVTIKNHLEPWKTQPGTLKTIKTVKKVNHENRPGTLNNHQLSGRHHCHVYCHVILSWYRAFSGYRHYYAFFSCKFFRAKKWPVLKLFLRPPDRGGGNAISFYLLKDQESKNQLSATWISKIRFLWTVW